MKNNLHNKQIMPKVKVEEVYSLVSELIKIPSINANKKLLGLDDIAKFVQKWFAAHEVKSRIVEFKKGYPVVIAESGSGKKTILLNGHMDTVPSGEIGKWALKPFCGKISKGAIHGRGASDMKAGLGILMAIMADMNGSKDCKLIFTAVSDEETGGFNCSRYIAEKYSPDLVFVAEPTTPRMISVGEKGVFHIKIITMGKAVHSSIPSAGSNAIMSMLEDLRALSNISSTEVKINPKIKSVLENSVKEFGNDAHIITFNPSIISGGIKTNVVPDRCEAEVDMRIPPGISMKQSLKIAKSLVKNGKIVLYPGSEPSYIDTEDKHLIAFRKTVEKRLGSSKLIIGTGATDGRFFRENGITTIVYGPGQRKAMHAYNELVSLVEIKEVYGVYWEFFSNLHAYR